MKSFNKKGSLVLSTFFHFFSVYPFLFVFNLSSARVVHDLFEAVAMPRPDEARKVNVTRPDVIHRTCPGATPVVTDIAYHWHQYREIRVSEVLGFEHTVAKASMLEALVVCWALVPKRGGLLAEAPEGGRADGESEDELHLYLPALARCSNARRVVLVVRGAPQYLFSHRSATRRRRPGVRV